MLDLNKIEKNNMHTSVDSFAKNENNMDTGSTWLQGCHSTLKFTEITASLMTTEAFLNRKYSLQKLLSLILQCINLQNQTEHEK